MTTYSFEKPSFPFACPEYVATNASVQNTIHYNAPINVKPHLWWGPPTHKRKKAARLRTVGSGTKH